MKKFTFQRFYPLLIVIMLISVWLANRWSDTQTEQAARSALQNSVYWEPHEYFGVWCQSDLNLGNPRIPFNYTLYHPPGDRKLVMETVRRLVRTGAKPQPWPEESLYRFAILRTKCLRSWKELYDGISWTKRSEAASLLEHPDNPTEADYRQALIRVAYEEMGTVDAALEWYPLPAK